MDAADRLGLSPISKVRLHRLIFLTNCLAEVFSTLSPSQKIIKYKRGPYYPDVQWQLDRLVTMDLVTVDKLKLEKDEYGPWLEGDYCINNSGIKLIDQICKKQLGLSLKKYVDELVFAFIRIPVDHLDDIALKDLNYGQAGIAEGALITFDEPDENKALLKIKEFENFASSMINNREFEKARIYLQYLDKVVI